MLKFPSEEKKVLDETVGDNLEGKAELLTSCTSKAANHSGVWGVIRLESA